ncbi:MAG: hypoxanthine phosphoribosyltransferase [Tissierellia bacterium]|nr:hypoxanthine phosphoribosyltransferase [Tissierellia bacterium]
MNIKRKVLYTKDQIARRIKELGVEINNNYKDEEIIVISLLRGSFIFTADLVREIDSLLAVDFMVTSSYENNEISSGNVDILMDHRINIKNRNVLIVDDIIDSGNTMLRVYEHLVAKAPKSVKICVMLDKPSRREVDIEADYVGFSIPDLFVVGYGLNYGEHHRNEAEIFTFER